MKIKLLTADKYWKLYAEPNLTDEEVIELFQSEYTDIYDELEVVDYDYEGEYEVAYYLINTKQFYQ